MYSKSCKCLITGIFSAIIGLAISLLAFLGIIPGILIIPWIGLGISIFTILFLLVLTALPLKKYSKCFCSNNTCILIGSFGSLIFSLISLVFGLFSVSLLSAIFVGLVVFFTVLNLISFLHYLICSTKCNYCSEGK